MDRTRHQQTTVVARATLYVVATPIGNLADITLRALDVLRGVDLIAAEDTRVTGRLLAHYGIDAPLFSLREHNERLAATRVMEALAQGSSVALVSDAGTPAISDPGAIAVRMAREAGYAIVPIPGPSAMTCAWSVAGSKAAHALFYGFLPQQKAARRRDLEALKGMQCDLVFYEAPHRVLESVKDMAEILGEARSITIARELTKIHESLHQCSLGEAQPWMAADENRSRGEFVLLVQGALEENQTQDDHARVLSILMRELTLKQAVHLTTEITGARRGEIYSMALALKEQQ